MAERKSKPVHIVVPPEDMDLIRELDEEVFRRTQAGEKIDRSKLILDRLRNSPARKPVPPAKTTRKKPLPDG